MSFNFYDYLLDDNNSPILIAEAGISHFGSISKAYELIDMASKSGCKTIKFQHFNAKELISDNDLSWQERLSGRDTNKLFIKDIYDYAQKKKIHCFFTPHTEKALEELIDLNIIDVIKIGSGERGNISFLKKALDTGAFVIISTGTYEDNDLIHLKNLLKQYKPFRSCVMHCTTSYPTPSELVNLKTIEYLSKLFSDISFIGYSDHTEGISIPIASVVLGARIIEKHISLEKNIPNAQDWKVSSFKEDLPILVDSINNVWQASRHKIMSKEISEFEKDNRGWANKSCYLTKDLYPNMKLTKETFVAQRPFTGLTPYEVQKEILGKTYKGKNVLNKGEALTRNLINHFS